MDDGESVIVLMNQLKISAYRGETA